MPLVDTEPVIMFIREQSQRDLALVAIVAAMCDSEEEACARLKEVVESIREYNKTFDRRQRGGHRNGQLVDNVLRVAPRLISLLEDLIQKRDDPGKCG